jgi:transcriptional regulator with XRE-family HTH domain
MKKESEKDKEFEKLLSLMKFNNKEKKYHHDAYILMAGYLSEIESIQAKRRMTRKELANKIGVKPPYLTQIFRGNKPLNFLTLAKIKEQLNIRFEVRAVDLSETLIQNQQVYLPISTFDITYKNEIGNKLQNILIQSNWKESVHYPLSESAVIGEQNLSD